MCPLKTETSLEQREDLIEVAATFVGCDQTIEFLLRRDQWTHTREKELEIYSVNDDVETANLGLQIS